MSDSFTAEQLDAIREFIRNSTKDEDYFTNTYEEQPLQDDREMRGSCGYVERVRLRYPEPDEVLPESQEFAIKTVTISDWRRIDNRQEQGVAQHMRCFYQACYEAVVVQLYNLVHPNVAQAYPERHWIVLPRVVTEDWGLELMEFLDGDSNIPVCLLEALIGTKIYMVFEWFDHDMRSLLPKARIQDERRLVTLKQHVQSIILQVVIGLGFLHEKCIVHGDLKIDNVYVNEQQDTGHVRAVIGDLGMNKYIRNMRFDNPVDGHRLFWVAPDRLLTTKFDIWSVGHFMFYCVMFCATGRIVSGSKWETFQAMVNEKRYIELRQFLCDNLPDEHRAVRELIVQCLQWEPSDRPDCQTMRKILDQDEDVNNACIVANHIMVHHNGFKHSEQIIFPNCIRNLLAIHDDPSLVQTLHPELSKRIRLSLSRGDNFPIIDLFANCDSRLLNEFAEFVNNADLHH